MIGDVIEVDSPMCEPLEIIEIGIQGPMGPTGPRGLPGAGLISIPFIGVAVGQVITLVDSISGAYYLVINGLVEQATNYSISGNTLVIPAGLVWDGAQCCFYYVNGS